MTDLAVIVQAWPRLPEAVRKGIVAMVRAVGTAASTPGARAQDSHEIDDEGGSVT